MNLEIMQARWNQFHGWLIELYGATRSDASLWTKGRHERIGGMLQQSQSRARLALMRAEARRQRLF